MCSAETTVPALVTCSLSVRSILESSLQIRRTIEMAGKLASTHMPPETGAILGTTEIDGIQDHPAMDRFMIMMILEVTRTDHPIMVAEAPTLLWEMEEYGVDP